MALNQLQHIHLERQLDPNRFALPVLPGAPRKWTREQYRRAAHAFRREQFEQREAEARGEEFNDAPYFLSRTGARWFFLRLAVIEDNLANRGALNRCRSALQHVRQHGYWPRRERVCRLPLPGCYL